MIIGFREKHENMILHCIYNLYIICILGQKQCVGEYKPGYIVIQLLFNIKFNTLVL